MKLLTVPSQEKLKSSMDPLLHLCAAFPGWKFIYSRTNRKFTAWSPKDRKQRVKIKCRGWVQMARSVQHYLNPKKGLSVSNLAAAAAMRKEAGIA